MIKYLDILIKKTSDQDPQVAYDESATTWKGLQGAQWCTVNPEEVVVIGGQLLETLEFNIGHCRLASGD